MQQRNALLINFHTAWGAILAMLALTVVSSLLAQPDCRWRWRPHVIETELNGPAGLAAVDFDSDGDMDIVVSSRYSNEVAWYRNESGRWVRTHIGYARGADELFVKDIDGDHLLDVIVLAAGSQTVEYFERLTPSGLEWLHFNIGEVNGPYDVWVDDMDGDGDMDIIVSEMLADEVTLFENVNMVWTRRHIGNLMMPGCACAVDINHDQRLDILVGAIGDDALVWYEAPDWNEHKLPRAIEGAGTGLAVADMNYDQQQDIIFSAALEGIFWFKAPNWDLNVIERSDFGFGPMRITVADMNLDGMRDVISTNMWSNDVTLLYGPKWDRYVVDNCLDSAYNVIAADMDEDKDLDLIVTGLGADLLLWYENPLQANFAAVNHEAETQPTLALLQNYPNPFNPATTIEFALPTTAGVSLKVYNLLGEVVDVIVNNELGAGTYRFDWNAGNLPSGLYIYRLEAGNFVQSRKMYLLR